MNKTHGHCRGRKLSPTYSTWMGMRRRCDDPDQLSYPDYGGRGITYCERWADFDNFLADMGERPTGMTLDRIDPEGDYTPNNCRWATARQQACNKRSSNKITAFGKTLSLYEWADEVGIKPTALGNRIARGWCVTRALLTPSRRYRRAAA